MTNPLSDFKKHRDQSKHEYKQQYHVQNEVNYCMAIYEGVDKKGNIKRASELVNNIEAGEYYKLSNKKGRIEVDIELVPHKHLETGYQLLQKNSKPFIIKKGCSAILLNDNEEQAEWENQKWLKERLYVVSGIDEDGIKLNYHQEARAGTDVITYMNEIINFQKFEELIPELSEIEGVDIENFKSNFNNVGIKKKEFFKKLQETLNSHYKENNIIDEKGNIKAVKAKESGLTTPKGGGVVGKYKEFPYVKFKPNGFYGLLEGVDFKITPTGKIEKV
ncbi:MAG: hypothetical protein JKY53_00530 [Flavobacteriales bacterium]|nr:hypothetical protein [Flavobacteriales bacterium]